MSHNQYKIRTFICVGCGIRVTKRVPKNRKYCCHECYLHSKHPNRKTGKIVKCDWCGKEIYKCKSALKHSKNYFCNLECANKYQSRNKDKYICKTCGNVFYRSPYWKSHGYILKYCSMKCRNNSKDWHKVCINGNLIQQKKKGLNAIELKGRAILQEAGLELEKDFMEQTLINKKFLVDIFIPKYKLVIQWDGDYWHCHPKFKNPDKRQIKRRELDKSQDKYLKKCGFTVLRFWEFEIKREVKGIDYIKRTIQKVTGET